MGDIADWYTESVPDDWDYDCPAVTRKVRTMIYYKVERVESVWRVCRSDGSIVTMQHLDRDSAVKHALRLAGGSWILVIDSTGSSVSGRLVQIVNHRKEVVCDNEPYYPAAMSEENMDRVLQWQLRFGVK